MAELYTCTHLDWVFTVRVRYSKKHGCWIVDAPDGTYYVSDYEAVLRGFERCEPSKSGVIRRDEVKIIRAGLR